MDLVAPATLAAALVAVLDPAILLWILAGVAAGLVFGASPGLTATTGVALATPLTFGTGFDQAMALLLGLYCAGYFAGSVPAILINTPGAPGNAATALDGHRLARAGRADLALGLAIVASTLGGLLSLLVLTLAAPGLAGFALEFTSVEYFSLGLFGVVCVATVSGRSLAKGIAGAAIGMLLGAVGIDEVGGTTRFTLGLSELQGGIPLIPALIAFFAVAELLSQAANRAGAAALPPQQPQSLRGLGGHFVRNKWLVLKSALIGTFVGVLPGTGPTIAAWLAYGQSGAGERSAARAEPGPAPHPAQSPLSEPQAVRGVIASETANNAVTGGALVPLLTLGIPGDTVTAVLIGALLIQGIDPGPFFIIEHADLFARILAILLVSALLILVIGLLARGYLPRILAIPPRILLPVVGVLCVTGAFAINNAPFDVGLAAVLGIGGYALARFGFAMAPLVLGVVLGPIVEVNLRNALAANDMDPSVFVTRPISAVLLGALVLTLGFSLLRRRRRAADS